MSARCGLSASAAQPVDWPRLAGAGRSWGSLRRDVIWRDLARRDLALTGASGAPAGLLST